VKALESVLRAGSRDRWISHLAGLAAYELLALMGAAGDLAWLAGLQMLAALALVELAFGLANLRARRLWKVADQDPALPDKVAAADGILLRHLDGLPLRAALRCLGAWVLGGLCLVALVRSGPNWVGLALLCAFGAPTAVLCTARLSGAAVRVSLAMAKTPPSSGDLAHWPSLRSRFLAATLSPVLVALIPLAAMACLGIPMDARAVAAVFLIGITTAFFWSLDLDAGTLPALKGMTAGLRRMAEGDFEARLGHGGADALGEAANAFNAAVQTISLRELSLRAFGPGLDPARGAAQADLVGARSEMRPVALLLAQWHNADTNLSNVDATARPAALGRFYEVVQDAAKRNQGTVLELGGGCVLVAWGAPLPAAANEPLVQEALTAAWMLKASLGVLQRQQQLRGGGNLEWSVAVSTGKAAGGWWGPPQRRQWALVGGPVAEVRRLVLKPGGPWLDERTASAAARPFAVQVLPEGLELVGGPDKGPGAQVPEFKAGESQPWN
jgi:class 3 adenylate cyclase